jgi:hypothetical protein
LTSSGRIDRKALPAPEFAAASFRAPQTPTEKIVGEVFAEVLGVDRAGLVTISLPWVGIHCRRCA